MRYTTVIDITELPSVYRNIHARLLYLHMALKAGYHDEDRDRLAISIRNLAYACGLSLSATRHALKVLQDAELIKREGATWYIKKWFADTPPTPRPKQSQAKGVKDAGKIADEYDRQRAENQQRVMAAVRDMTVEELQVWHEELLEGKARTHRRAYLPANKECIAWLEQVIKQKQGQGQ